MGFPNLRPAMKTLFKIALVLLVLLGLLIGGLFLSIDKLAKSAVEKGGTLALGTPTHAGKVDLSIFKGRLELENLAVENPQGYGESNFFALQRAAFQVDPESMQNDVIRVPELTISGVDLTLIKNSRGTNYGQILDHLKRFEQTAKEASSEPEKSAPSKKFVVDRILIENVNASADMEVLGRKFDPVAVTVPTIEIKNFGTADGAKTPADILSKVVREVLDAVMKEGKNLLPTEMLSDLQGQLAGLKGDLLDQGKEKLQGLTEGVKGKVEGVLGGAQDKVEDVKNKANELLKGAGGTEGAEGGAADGILDGEKVEDVKKKAGEALDGILGGKKKP